MSKLSPTTIEFLVGRNKALMDSVDGDMNNPYEKESQKWFGYEQVKDRVELSDQFGVEKELCL